MIREKRKIKKEKIFFLLFSLFSFLLILSVHQSSAQESGSQEQGCAYNKEVKIAFAFIDEGAVKKSANLISEWEQGIKQAWNEQTIGDCGCKVSFDFQIAALAEGQDCRNTPADHHCFNVMDKPTNNRGHIADALPVGNGLMRGEWSTGADAGDAAYIAGQLLGASDDYQFEDQDADGNADSLKQDQTNQRQRIAQIAVQNQFVCENRCCCGNGRIDKTDTINEACDQSATPNGCSQNQACNQCICEETKETPPTTPAPSSQPPATSPKPQVPSTQPEPQSQPQQPETSAACRSSSECNDGNVCTEDTCANPGTAQARCDNFPITGCMGGDGCCPSSCYSRTDSDCKAVCDNGYCESGETCSNCPEDCGTCGPVCGNNQCESGESCQNCPADCGSCAGVCGNGTCEPDYGETLQNCPADCSFLPNFTPT